jgi:hypothetical protein
MSPFAPHTFQPVDLKNGDIEEAIKIYNLAKESETYQEWPYRAELENRIKNATKNEVDFNRPLNIKYAGRIVNEGPICNIEIHYTNLYNLESLKNLCTGLRRHSGVINCENIKKGLLINFSEEYEKIVNYSQITNSM